METLKGLKVVCSAVAKYETAFEYRNRITLNEAIILEILSGKGVTASFIASESGLSVSNTSKVLKKLESKWLIERSICATDKRKMYFTLTKEGKSLYSRVKKCDIEMDECLSQFIATIEEI